MAQDVNQYTGALSTPGFLGGILQAVSGLFGKPAPALPTRPASSQVLIAQNAGRRYQPDGSLVLTDLWYNPYGVASYSETDLETNYHNVLAPNPTYGIGGPTYGYAVPTYSERTKSAPNFGPSAPYYAVVSQSPEALAEGGMSPFVDKLSGETTIFRSPESATYQPFTECSPPPSEVAETKADRINRLTQNQFFSPFRARRTGGNSYQALSEMQDNIFSPTGKAGDFAEENMPEIVQSRRQQRIFRG